MLHYGCPEASLYTSGLYSVHYKSHHCALLDHQCALLKYRCLCTFAKGQCATLENQHFSDISHFISDLLLSPSKLKDQCTLLKHWYA